MARILRDRGQAAWALRGGVAGWVRNRSDGAVEAVFEGSPEVVDSMIRSSRHGPRGARVERVQVYEEEPAGSQEFRVLG